MNSRLKKIVLFLITSLILPFSVFAKEDIELSVDKKDLKIGDEIVVTAKMAEDLESYALIATLKYDENVFQRIDESDFAVAINSSINYNKANNKFGIINRTGQAQDGILFRVNLKVKDKANVGDTNIALTNISSSDGSEKKEYTANTLKVFVSRDMEKNEEISGNKENNISPDTEEIIKVFTNKPIIIISTVLTIGLLGYILFYGFKKNKNKKILISLIVADVALGVITGSMFINNYNKKDVNDDGIKNYDDAEEIIKYLIDIKGIDEEEKIEENEKEDNTNTNSTSTNTNSNKKPSSNSKPTKPKNDYDTNNDGKVDVDDVGNVVEDVTKNTSVKLQEVNPNNEYYIDKGTIALNFKAEINPQDSKITKVKIGDEFYDVTLDSDIYSVTIDVNESGEKDFVISEVILDNNQSVKTNLKISREILKEIPYVNNFNLEDEKKTLSFDLVDNDDAFKEGTVTIYDGTESIKSAKLSKNNILKDLPIEEDKSYDVEIIGSYDLDSNKNEGKNSYNEETMFSHSFTIGGDYNFTLTDVVITDELQPGEIPVISFKSTNSRKANIKLANFTNDKNAAKSYQLIAVNDSNYEVPIVGADITPGEHTITLDSVQLDNLKFLENSKDYNVNVLNYTVLKSAPKAEDLTLIDKREEKIIEATFKLNDSNEAANHLIISLTDSSYKLASKVEFTKEEIEALRDKEFKVSLPYDNSTDGCYRVVVYADYDLSDKYHYTLKNIGENSILSPKDIYIQDMYLVNAKNEKIESPYVSKDSNTIQVAFEIVIGDEIKKYKSYGGISYVTINGLNCPISTIKTPDKNNGVYLIKATVKVPKESGILELTANRVQLSNNSYYHIWSDYYAVGEKSIKIEVLKDKPKIENLIVTEEDYDKGKVTFDFDIVLDNNATLNDNSFDFGSLTLDGKEGNPSVVNSTGHNKVTFENVSKDKKLDLIFKAKFDLDTNTLDTDKNELEEEIYKVNYGLYNKKSYQDVTINKGSSNKKYYEKNEDIELTFDITGNFENLGMNPKKVIIDDKEYELIKKDDSYSVKILGFHSFGRKEITITDVIFDYGQKVTLKDKYSLNVEVLKDVIKFNNLEYEVLENSIKVIFRKVDPDNSLVGKAKVIISDEQNNIIYDGNYQDEISFKHDANVLRYFVKVIGSYDRDINVTKNSENYYGDVTLLNEIISFERNNIELKNIIDINLYKQINDGTYDEIIKVDEVSLKEINDNKSAYFAEVVMENLPSIRTRIKEAIEKDKHLILILDYNYVTKEGKIKTNNVQIDFGEIKENGIAKNEFHPEIAIQKLIEELNDNKDITLMQNYDFSIIDNEDLVYVENYKGTLEGNDYTFKNLSKPLFDTLTGKVKNLNIVNVAMEKTGHGALANKAENAEVTSVYIDNVTRNAGDDSGQNGGLIGSTVNTKVEACRVTNVTINAGYYAQQNGLLIGTTSGSVDKSIIKNSYAEGRLLGGYNYTSGFVGNCKSTTVINNFVKVTASGQSGPVAAFGDAYGDQNSVYENNISIASGTTTNMIGSAKTINNNYFYIDNEATSKDGITVIDKNDINDELFITKAKFDPNIWYINNISFDNLPIFHKEKKTVLNDTSNENYREENETLYQNLIKLMPFYDSNKIITIAQNVTDINLNTKIINHIIPIDKEGKLVTYLTNSDIRKIAKIRVVFTDKTKIDYDVIYDKSYDMVASYRIISLGIDYNYNNYVIDENSQVVNNLTNYLQKINYGTDLDILTTNSDSRIYRDFYNEVTSKELKEFVLKYLANSEYTNTTNDKTINDYLEREVKKNQKLEKALYTYNYFRRFYDVEVGKMKLYDIMMFNMEGFNSDLTTSKIVDLFFSDKSGANFNTNLTSSKYSSVLGSYTKINNIVDFLEYVVTEFSNETDMANWVREQFKGILVELPIEGHPEILYTLWDHFRNPDKNYPNGVYGHDAHEFILPILTLPENSAYIISAPVEFIIGAQRTYISDPFDPQQVADFKAKMATYTTRLQSYFTTAYGILENKDLFNNMHLFILDKRNTKNIDGTGVYNNPYTTTEPFHKNFDEILGLWPAAAGNNAAAWGYYIEMQVAGVLDSNLTTDGSLDIGHVTFKTLTHESAHNLDDRLFFKNNGQRGGGEDYADAFLMQAFEKFGIVMNLSINFDLEKLNENNQAVGSNLTPERINTEAKISDFYNKAFQTIYTIDYLEAQAFLQLPKEAQEKLAIQISYPNAEKEVEFKDSDGKVYIEYVDENGQKQPLVSRKYKDDPYALSAAYSLTQYTKLDQVEDFDFSKLKTIDDLIDNKIMLYPGKEGVSTLGPGHYGGEGYNVVHWYQPHNDYGFPDSYSSKWISYEMLGYAGYTNGFVEYASNIHTTKRTFYTSLSATINKNGTLALSEINYKSDATALKIITNNQYENFDDYKKARFREVAANLDHLNKIINAKEYVQKFYNALMEDVNDKNLTKSSDVRYQIYSTLKNYTNDFRTNEIIMDSWQQNVSDLNVTK